MVWSWYDGVKELVSVDAVKEKEMPYRMKDLVIVINMDDEDYKPIPSVSKEYMEAARASVAELQKR